MRYKWMLVVLIIVGIACRHEPVRVVEPAFYYWKSVFTLNTAERSRVDQLAIKKLYVKFFDIVWDKESNIATPAAKVNIADTAFQSFDIVPVVFITNETLYHLKDSAAVEQLSLNACSLMAQLMKQTGMTPKEIQIDCDWTATTKDTYFQLLRSIKRQITQMGYDHFILSATIRLYQCRYLHKTGVPPVDKGLLMCYNMGNLKNYSIHNSILDLKEVRQYIASLDRYPLQLDVALPLFDWKVLFRQQQYAGLIKELSTDSLRSNPAVTGKGNRYVFLHDTVIGGYDFRKGDEVRDEQSLYPDIIETAKLVGRQLKNPHPSVVLYHLDSVTLSKYPVHEMEDMFGCFR